MSESSESESTTHDSGTGDSELDVALVNGHDKQSKGNEMMGLNSVLLAILNLLNEGDWLLGFLLRVQISFPCWRIYLERLPMFQLQLVLKTQGFL